MEARRYEVSRGTRQRTHRRHLLDELVLLLAQLAEDAQRCRLSRLQSGLGGDRQRVDQPLRVLLSDTGEQRVDGVPDRRDGRVDARDDLRHDVEARVRSGAPPRCARSARSVYTFIRLYFYALSALRRATVHSGCVHALDACTL